MITLTAKEVGMRTGALEANIGALYRIDQDPIRFDVEIAVGGPFAFQGVVAQLSRQRFFGKQQVNNLVQLFISLPRFSASFTSRRNWPVKLAERIKCRAV